MTCDICGKIDTELEPIRDEYKSDEIAQICRECMREANTHLDPIRVAVGKIRNGWVKRVMVQMKEKFK